MKKNSVKKLLSVFLCLVLTVGVFASCGKQEEEPTTTEAPTVQVTEAKREIGKNNPLTGESTLDAKMVGKRPIAIMVENSPSARPQWGLSTPDMVVEGVVEGGITRMMWLYADVNDVPKVGPTRSARHDYVELAEGFDAIYTHFGGSPYAYTTLEQDKVQDIDGVKGDGKYFKRDSSRKVSKEHTAYTKGEWLAQAIRDKKIRTDVKDGAERLFTFSEEKRTLPGGACQSIKVEFSNSYTHTFTFKDGVYWNHMNKEEMKDANGETMQVSNVLVLYCGTSIVPGSDKGHQDWDLSGGKGVYVSNGTYQNITWEKGSSKNATAPLKLMDEDGKELVLNTGKSWVGFVPKDNQGKTVIA